MTNDQSSMTRVEFRRRARREITETSRRRVWESVCGRYRIVEAVSLFGLPTVYYAQRRVDLPTCTWDLLVPGRHRKRGPAEASCRRDAENHE